MTQPLDELAPSCAPRAACSPPPCATRPRASRCEHGARAEVELLLEAIREGYELALRPLAPGRTDDDDLALLAGDRLYALGLERLAALGDLDAVRALADLISRVGPGVPTPSGRRLRRPDVHWARATNGATVALDAA